MIKNKIIEEFLNETSTSTIRRNRGDKRNAMAGRSALRICEEKNPSLYRKYERYRQLYLETKFQIKQKYGSKGKQMALRKIH